MKPIVFAECLLCLAIVYPPVSPPGEVELCAKCAEEVVADAESVGGAP